MKTKFTSLIFLVIAVACSKSSDPAAGAAGCTVTLKGTNYSLTTAAICTTIGTIQTLGGGNGTTGATINISKDSSNPSLATIIFGTSSATSSTPYIAGGGGISAVPTITVSGKTWTFSGTATNGSDSGAISGTCTCSN